MKIKDFLNAAGISAEEIFVRISAIDSEFSRWVKDFAACSGMSAEEILDWFCMNEAQLSDWCEKNPTLQKALFYNDQTGLRVSKTLDLPVEDIEEFIEAYFTVERHKKRAKETLIGSNESVLNSEFVT